MIDRDLKRSLGQMMKGVEVVSASHGGVTRAYCSHWVSQISFEEPILLASISPKHDTHPLLMASGRFAVSILAADQVDVGQYFSYPGRKFRYLAPEHLIQVGRAAQGWSSEGPPAVAEPPQSNTVGRARQGSSSEGPPAVAEPPQSNTVGRARQGPSSESPTAAAEPQPADIADGWWVVPNAIAWLGCEVIEQVTTSIPLDHDLVLARVVEVGEGRLRQPPLLYSSRLGWRGAGEKARQPGESVRDRLLERLAALGVEVGPDDDEA